MTTVSVFGVDVYNLSKVRFHNKIQDFFSPLGKLNIKSTIGLWIGLTS